MTQAENRKTLHQGDAEANEEEYMANGPYTGPLTIINVSKLHTGCSRIPRLADRG